LKFHVLAGRMQADLALMLLNALILIAVIIVIILLAKIYIRLEAVANAIGTNTTETKSGLTAIWLMLGQVKSALDTLSMKQK
jgi:hypothetical protein